MKTIWNWCYSVLGNPYWEWGTGQALLFYAYVPGLWEPDGEPPPMTYDEWDELERQQKRRIRREWESYAQLQLF